MQREVAPGLREQWLQLVERRVDILLRKGETAGLVSELTTLTARHPLRERLCGLLMRALYRAGRRSEALDVYHRFRRRLREELGVDPGEEIRAVHAAVLTSRPGDDRDAVPVPRELPSGTAVFTGRSRDLAALDEPQAVAVVTGTAGVGKTTLAVHWARRVADEFPDGQLFADLRGYHPSEALSPQQVQSRFLRALGVRGENIPADPDELTSLYRSTLDGRRLLLLLDNANGDEQVRPLLPDAAGCMVVITSRDALPGLTAVDGVHRVNLDLLTLAEARELLARRLGAERLDAEPRAADDIIAASARPPLALAIAAARAASEPDSRLGVLAARLHDGLDAFDTDSAVTDVRGVFSWSYRALSPDAARLLRLLGLHPRPQVTAPPAASLIGLPLERTRTLLDELVRAHLVIEQVPGRYVLHDLMREYAAELVAADETEADRDSATRRALDHYLYTAIAAVTVLEPQRNTTIAKEVPPEFEPEDFTDYDAAAAWFDVEQEVLFSVRDWAATAGFARHVSPLVTALATHLELQGLWPQMVACHQTALAAAERLGDPTMQAHAHRGLGHAYISMVTRTEDAHKHLVKALELYRESGSLNGQTYTETCLAMLNEQQHRYPQALEHALRALELQKQQDSGVGYAFALNAVAWCQALVGEYRLALDYGRQASAKYQEITDPTGNAANLDTIGYIRHHLGQFAEAIDSYRQAVDLYRQLGNRYYAALSLDHLGDSYEALGDQTAAHDNWRQAETIFDELQHPEWRKSGRNSAAPACDRGPTVPPLGGTFS